MESYYKKAIDSMRNSIQHANMHAELGNLLDNKLWLGSFAAWCKALTHMGFEGDVKLAVVPNACTKVERVTVNGLTIFTS